MKRPVNNFSNALILTMAIATVVSERFLLPLLRLALAMLEDVAGAQNVSVEQPLPQLEEPEKAYELVEVEPPVATAPLKSAPMSSVEEGTSSRPSINQEV